MISRLRHRYLFTPPKSRRNLHLLLDFYALEEIEALTLTTHSCSGVWIRSTSCIYINISSILDYALSRLANPDSQLVCSMIIIASILSPVSAWLTFLPRIQLLLSSNAYLVLDSSMSWLTHLIHCRVYLPS